MKLNTGIIANSLPYQPQFVCGQYDHSLTLSDIRTLLPESGLYSQDILYFAEWPVIAQLNGKAPSYAVCVGGGKIAADFFESKGMAGIILDDHQPAMAFSIIQSIFLRFNQLEYRLMTALLAKETTQEILNCCSEVFQNHAILFDNELNMIDYSTNYLPGDDDEIWAETLRTKRRSEKMLVAAKKNHLAHAPIDTPSSVRTDVGEGLPNNITYSFYDINKRLAMLVIVENNKPLSPVYLKLLDHISELIYPNLFSRYSNSFGSVDNLRSVFVSILNKVGVDPLIVGRSLGAWNLRDDYRLILIYFPDAERSTEVLTRYLYIYEEIFPECVAFKYVESLVMVIRNDTAEVMSESIPKLEKQLSRHNAICGVSYPFNSIYQINSHYINADMAIQLGDKNKRIRYLKDVITHHLINKVARDMPLMPLCNREAVRVFDYDSENGTELLLTLETYLRQNKSLKAAAEELFIHRSTLTYRLGCIEKLTKIDFDDSKERLHILLSCIVLRNLGSERSAP